MRRPARASRALVRWARRTGREHLVGTYIAKRSRHNLGSAVDLTLVRRRDGRQLPMGTHYDHLGPRAMERFGFTNYRREWWHFEHRVRGVKYLDLTLGC